MINATIWLRVSEEAKIPMEVLMPIKKISPIYAPQKAPPSILPTGSAMLITE